MIILDDWTIRAAALRDELVAAGKLTSPEWQAAVLAVPRHKFVPEFYQRGTDPGPTNWELVSALSPDTRERWWNEVWANTFLVTQLGPVGRLGRQVVTGPSSSSSAPSLMTRMLEALDIRDGNRVLEIGTGSGYNAALMSHRLGDQNVFSLDVDAELVDSARDRLAALGYQPTLISADGVTGLPQYAPYDRIIATCAVSRVPWSWGRSDHRRRPHPGRCQTQRLGRQPRAAAPRARPPRRLLRRRVRHVHAHAHPGFPHRTSGTTHT